MHTSLEFVVALVSGSMSGLCVDIVLYPLDTVKTRLQSAEGFVNSGGFRGIYRGLGSILVGSAPGAALFFSTYEMVKLVGERHFKLQHQSLVHMLAACSGEIVACCVRVPTEVVKQRTMTTQRLSSYEVLRKTIHSEGFLGLYRGFTSTVMREIPFSLIQFPLWEYLKKRWSENQRSPVQPWQSSICGAIAGGFSAALTTPLDVAKTRIMLAKAQSDLSRGHILSTLKVIYLEKGFSGLYAGVLPRTIWISFGGAIFLGVYDKARQILTMAMM